jgi:hypothetical protein
MPHWVTWTVEEEATNTGRMTCLRIDRGPLESSGRPEEELRGFREVVQVWTSSTCLCAQLCRCKRRGRADPIVSYADLRLYPIAQMRCPPLSRVRLVLLGLSARDCASSELPPDDRVRGAIIVKGK